MKAHHLYQGLLNLITRKAKRMCHRKEVGFLEKMVAFCGLTCTECPGFIATQKNDYEAKKKLAKAWSSETEVLKPEDINCDGCLAVGKRQINFCSTCEVRSCAMERDLENCAHCDEYACAKLDRLWGILKDSTAKTTLDSIRKGL